MYFNEATIRNIRMADPPELSASGATPKALASTLAEGRVRVTNWEQLAASYERFVRHHDILDATAIEAVLLDTYGIDERKVLCVPSEYFQTMPREPTMLLHTYAEHLGLTASKLIQANYTHFDVVPVVTIALYGRTILAMGLPPHEGEGERKCTPEMKKFPVVYSCINALIHATAACPDAADDYTLAQLFLSTTGTCLIEYASGIADRLQSLWETLNVQVRRLQQLSLLRAPAIISRGPTQPPTAVVKKLAPDRSNTSPELHVEGKDQAAEAMPELLDSHPLLEVRLGLDGRQYVWIRAPLLPCEFYPKNPKVVDIPEPKAVANPHQMKFFSPEMMMKRKYSTWSALRHYPVGCARSKRALPLAEAVSQEE